MSYLDSTLPQVSRVVGGWCLGGGLLLFALTFKELGTSHRPVWAIVAILVVVGGGLLLVLGSKRLAAVNRSNRVYFAKNAGTEILARRRLLQTRLTALRWGLFLTLIAVATTWVVFVGTYSCIDGVCKGFVSNQDAWILALRWACFGLGAVTLVIATLTRVHGSETDRWEELASDYLRRRDDGPVAGTKRSRWE